MIDANASSLNPADRNGMLAAKLSKVFPNGVCVRRCVSVFLCFFVLCAAHPAAAEQSPSNDFSGQIMSGYNGRVGVGTMRPPETLDIYQGEIKIGSTGADCTRDLAGALPYVDAHLQLCDGAGWRNVSL